MKTSHQTTKHKICDIFPVARDEHLSILLRWSRYSSIFNLGEVLRKNNIHKIAIYGGGVLGTVLYENLCQNIQVECIIDKNPNLSFPYEVRTILPSEIELIRNVDAVIITVDFFIIEKIFRQYTKCLSLDDLIIDLDEYFLFEKTVQYITECNATLLLGDLSAPARHIKNPSFFEAITIYGSPDWRKFYDKEIMLSYFNDLDCCSPEYIKEIIEYPRQTIKKGNYVCFNDQTSKYFNVINNCRVTTNVPDKYDNSIHFFGFCTTGGFAVEDKYTIESYLQRLLNDSPLDKVFRVINCATWNDHRGKYFLRMLDTKFQPGDYAILLSSSIRKYKFYYQENEIVHYCDLTSAFDRPHEFEGEIFFDACHMNHRGHKLLAKKIYNILKVLPPPQTVEAVTNTTTDSKTAISGLTDTIPSPAISKSNFGFEGLEKYLEYLESEKFSTVGIIGSIVMNCNPFTLGHRYLIEAAKNSCDFLYIFIVEEDKSYFPFEERFECVKKGIADIRNVKVLPSGRFIISTLTFPEYFIKEQSNATIDASLDIKLFAEHIAPILNIKKRFAGQEPLCQVTHQYNMAMKELLPQYGIEFILFERKEVNSIPISASKVRELLNNKNFAELKLFVPESTYKYLMHFKKTL